MISRSSKCRSIATILEDVVQKTGYNTATEALLSQSSAVLKVIQISGVEPSYGRKNIVAERDSGNGTLMRSETKIS